MTVENKTPEPLSYAELAYQLSKLMEENYELKQELACYKITNNHHIDLIEKQKRQINGMAKQVQPQRIQTGRHLTKKGKEYGTYEKNRTDVFGQLNSDYHYLWLFFQSKNIQP